MTHKPLAIAIAWAYLGTATGGYDRTAGEWDFLPGVAAAPDSLQAMLDRLAES